MSFSSLEIGKRALLAQKFGLDITGNNIANVNTPGYSRRTAILAETDQIKQRNNYLGTGVVVNKIQNFREEYYDKEVRNTLSKVSNFDNDATYLRRLETVLAEPGETGINEIVSEFFNKFEELTVKPESLPLRQNLLSIATTLSDRLNYTANSISDLRDEVKKKSNSIATNINSLLADISSLNSQILRSGNNATSESQSLIDERANRLEDLSKLIDTKIGTNDDGSVNVFVNGMNILTANVTSTVKISENINQTTGERTLMLMKNDGENSGNIELEPQSGELYSNLKLYNVTFDDLDSSANFSVAKNINDFASTLANKVNSFTKIGYGLNDTPNSNPNRNFFEGNGAIINAFNIKVNQGLINNPADLPLSTIAGESGNSTISSLIAKISIDNNFLNNQNPIDYYTNLLGKIGNITKETENSLNSTKLIEQQLNSQRESVMGVNMDEEAVNLIKFQKAFEAASRIVNTSNEILGTLVNLGR
ncbi:MAG TPA: flagellar hook-associated protein FlgK [Candidatus Kapabacteria bacterium]|nr:flagellar hook-associated protein FlgK [Candidatus Kapabacteria bacterium]